MHLERRLKEETFQSQLANLPGPQRHPVHLKQTFTCCRQVRSRSESVFLLAGVPKGDNDTAAFDPKMDHAQVHELARSAPSVHHHHERTLKAVPKVKSVGAVAIGRRGVRLNHCSQCLREIVS